MQCIYVFRLTLVKVSSCITYTRYFILLSAHVSAHIGHLQKVYFKSNYYKSTLNGTSYTTTNLCKGYRDYTQRKQKK
jgi:hypothetical protein